ncbi:LysE family transporter, partial [Escherichia coli]|uniref:LysE family transporter n=1 Tax=Escherichia coli TaxID=562 RepID=UPI0038601C6E
MMSLWDALRMNMMISYQELVRTFLSQAFSLPAVRRAYGRMQRVASRVIGAIIGVFALRLIYEGVTQR